MKTPREVKDWIKAAETSGWTVEPTKGSHVRFRPPRGWTDRSGQIQCPLITSSTPSDKRGMLNFRAQLRRAGLKV